MNEWFVVAHNHTSEDGREREELRLGPFATVKKATTAVGAGSPSYVRTGLYKVSEGRWIGTREALNRDGWEIPLPPTCICGRPKTAHSFTKAWPQGFWGQLGVSVSVCWSYTEKVEGESVATVSNS